MSDPKAYTPIFEERGEKYWLELPDGEFQRLGEGNIKRRLRHVGVNDFAPRGENSDLDDLLAVSQIKRRIDFAWPIAGRRVGLFTTADGRTLLVPYSAPKWALEPPPLADIEKPWPFIERFLCELLGAVTVKELVVEPLGSSQINTALAWLKCAAESLAEGHFKPGQVLVLCGPPACGKSFFQHLVTLLLGGRGESCARYLYGGTEFNEELASAEHLFIEELKPEFKRSRRVDFGNSLKKFAVNEKFELHGKGKMAATVSNFRRVTISCNLTPDSITGLPPLASDLVDKITILKCHPAKLSEDRSRNIAGLKRDLPAFRAFLFHELRIDGAMRDSRLGCKSWQHPEILLMLADTAPERKFLDIVDAVEFMPLPNQGPPPPEEVTLPAMELERRLLRSDWGGMLQNMIRENPSFVGQCLAKLSDALPHRVRGKFVRGRRLWTIFAEGGVE